MINISRFLILLITCLFSMASYAGDPAPIIKSATVNGSFSTSVTSGATINVKVTLTKSQEWQTTKWLITDSNNSTISSKCHTNSKQKSRSSSFSITAPNTDGTYSVSFIAYKDDKCSENNSNTYTLSDSIIVGSVGASELLCSTESSNAIINEIQTLDNFIEIYLLNSTDILNWALYVGTSKIATLGLGNCEINGTAALDNSGTGASNTIFPAGTFISCDTAVNPAFGEVLLADSNASFVNGDSIVIDYIGYGNLVPSADWQVNSSCGMLYPGHSAANKDIARVPDGTGNLEDNDDNSTKGTTNEPPVITVDHFEISYTKAGFTCLPSPITIKACADAACTAVITDDVDITLSPATGWTNNPVTISNGQATLDLNHPTAGNLPLDITASSITPVNALSCLADNNLDPSCSITVSETGFIFDVPTLTACKPSANVTIKAVKQGANTAQCISALTGNKILSFWSDYDIPATGQTKVKINGTDIATSSAGININLTFDANGEAQFTAQYNDTGRLNLTTTYDDGNGLVMTGSDLFVSKPVTLVSYSSDGNAACSSQDASCSRFKKAGETFDLKVNAACWTSDADTNFTDNPTTPNFELASIGINHNVIAPSSGVNGQLSQSSFNFSIANSGTHTIQQTVSEVGAFEFDIITPLYLGEALTTTKSEPIGRFYPDHFETTTASNGSFGNNACTGFSYSGQAFSYLSNPQLLVTAFSANSPATVTQNYQGDFAKLTDTDFIVTTPTSDANQLGADSTNLVRLNWQAAAPALTDNNNGSLTFAFGNDSYTYQHEINSQIAPFSNAVDLTFTAITDSDNVSTSTLPHTLQPSGESIRFGRIALDSGHGSELMPLAIAISAKYYTGFSWIENSADQCTALNLNNHIRLANPETAGGSPQAGTTIMTIAAGTTSATLTNTNPFAAGSGFITLSAPGEDNLGFVDISSNIGTTYPWLLDLNNGEAQGRASFGLFKGSDNIIFRRERF